MILDKIENIGLYKALGPRVKKAITYIENTDLSVLVLGNHVIDGENIFVIVQEYDTKDIDEGKMEAHRKYIDIQFILRGTEMFGFDTLNDQTPTMEYSEERDVMFFGNDYASLLKVNAGSFVIFYPWDIHMPGIKAGEKMNIRKAVFKIRVD
ncbi:MAG: YhcH/YjgK/YiaL family protein [Bacteroidia bacterium]